MICLAARFIISLYSRVVHKTLIFLSVILFYCKNYYNYMKRICLTLNETLFVENEWCHKLICLSLATLSGIPLLHSLHERREGANRIKCKCASAESKLGFLVLNQHFIHCLRKHTHTVMSCSTGTHSPVPLTRPSKAIWILSFLLSLSIA